jgi:hypothetical protein
VTRARSRRCLQSSGAAEAGAGRQGRPRPRLWAFGRAFGECRRIHVVACSFRGAEVAEELDAVFGEGAGGVL